MRFRCGGLFFSPCDRFHNEMSQKSATTRRTHTREELEGLQGHLLCEPTKARLCNGIYNTSAVLLHNHVC